MQKRNARRLVAVVDDDDDDDDDDRKGGATKNSELYVCVCVRERARA